MPQEPEKCNIATIRTWTKKGLGGALVLPAVFLILQPIAMLGQLSRYWTIHYPYIPVWKMTGLVLDSLVVLISIFLSVLYFKKKTSFPGLFLLFILFLLPLWGFTFILGDDEAAVPMMFAIQMVFVFVPYFSLSRRVQATFHPAVPFPWEGSPADEVKKGLSNRIYWFFRRTRKLSFLWAFIYTAVIIGAMLGVGVGILGNPL